MPKRAGQARAASGSEGAIQRSKGKVDRAMIQALAYRKYLDRGRAHGHDVEDWLEAERELIRGVAVSAAEMFRLYEKRTA